MLNKNNKKKKDNKKENISDINKMNKKNNKKEKINKINKDNNNLTDNSTNLNNYSIVNPNLSEKENFNLINIEDNKKGKHSSSFQQASEFIHTIQSFFHSFKKSSSSNSILDSLSSSNNKKEYQSDTKINIIKKEKEPEEVASTTTMDKIKIQRSKSIPFNNTNSSQRNSCHFHKHSSLSSVNSTITSMSTNRDISHHYDSGSETNESRIEYSTPKENENSFSFSSCQSSFSFTSAFTSKMAPIINNLESKGQFPISPKSISSEKSDLLSVTPHVVGPLEGIKEKESSITETISCLPLEHCPQILEGKIGKRLSNNEKSDQIKKVENNLKELEEDDKEKLDISHQEKNLNFLISPSEMNDQKESFDPLKLSMNSFPLLLNSSNLSSSSQSSLSSLDINSIQPSSPSSPLKKKNKNKHKENFEDSRILPQSYQESSQASINTQTKSPELFKMEPFDSANSFKKSTPQIPNGKSMLLFSSPSTDDISKSIREENGSEEVEEKLINKLKIENSPEFESKILKMNTSPNSENNNSLSHKDIIVNSSASNLKKSSVIVNKNLNVQTVNTTNKEKSNSITEEKSNKLEVCEPKERSPRKTMRCGSKDNYLNPLNNIINEDTLIDSENGSLISNVVSVSESESTSIPTNNAFPGEVQHNFESKTSNLIIESLDEEFIHIAESENGSMEQSSKERIKPTITIEDADEFSEVYKTPENLNNDRMNESVENDNNSISPSLSPELINSHNNLIPSNNYNYLLKERSPNDNSNNKYNENELIFSKETTSSIAVNNSEKRDEDNYSYYSNPYSPDLPLVSSVNSDDKYTRNYYEKSQFYKKNKNGKKSADYERSLKEYAVSLEKEMMDFYTKNLPTEESKERKKSLLDRIKNIFKERYPNLGIDAHLFGSSVNELGTYNSDVDICITTKDRMECELNDMEVIKKILEEHGVTKVRTTPNAKVPICNFVDPETKLSCDINVNNTIALYNTKMIQTYALIDERVKPLIMTIKYFAKQRMLNDAKTGTLSSYCWVNMVINFLQMRNPPILPCLHAMTKNIPKEKRIIIDGIDCTIYTDLDKLKGFGKDNKETLYELIFGFFKTFACDFDYITDVVSVRSGCYKKKSDNGWNVSSNNTRIRNNYFCVEEPFNTARNLANCANRYSVKGLRWEFKRAFKILKARGSLEELCEPYKPDLSNYTTDSNYYYLNQNRMGLPIENGNYNIHNDHLFINNTSNTTFTAFKNGKSNNQFPNNGLTMADKNGNWRARNNGSSSPVNNKLDNPSYQNNNNRKIWHTKKKSSEMSDTMSNSDSNEGYYCIRRFPNDGSYMSNNYSNSVFINNKRTTNNSNNNKTNTDKDSSNSSSNRKSDKSPFINNKDLDEIDNEKVNIKHRFIEHNRNFDNTISSPFSSSPHFYFANPTNTINNNTPVINNNNNNKSLNNTNTNNSNATLSYIPNNKVKSRSNELLTANVSNTIINEKSSNTVDLPEKQKTNKNRSEKIKEDMAMKTENNTNINSTSAIKDFNSKESIKTDKLVNTNSYNRRISKSNSMTNEVISETISEEQSYKVPNTATNQLFITSFSNFNGYVFPNLGHEYYNSKLSLTNENISKQTFINNSGYQHIPLYLNPTAVAAANNNTKGSTLSINQNGENKQTLMTCNTYPVFGGNSYGQFLYIPSHPSGTPFQNRAQTMSYPVYSIPCPHIVVVDSMNSMINSRENIPLNENSHKNDIEDKKEIPDTSKKNSSNDNKNERPSNKQAYNNKKYNGTSKADNQKKSQWPNSQFHTSKTNKKSLAENNYKSGKQKSKEIDESSSSNTKEFYTPSQKRKNNNNGNDENEEHFINRNSSSKIEKFAIKNSRRNDGPTEFSLASSSFDSEQVIISTDSNRSEEERTLYNEDLCCEPGQMDSDSNSNLGDLDIIEDNKGGQSSNFNIRNSVSSGNKGSEILFINLENKIILGDIIDCKNSKENKNVKGKKCSVDNTSQPYDNRKGKTSSLKKANSTASINSVNKEKKNKKNNNSNSNKGNKGDPVNKINNQSKNDPKDKGRNSIIGNNGNSKNKNSGNKNNKKEENNKEGKRMNNPLNNKSRMNSVNNTTTTKENKTYNNKTKESKDKLIEKNKGDETMVITTVTTTTTVITNNSNSKGNLNNSNGNNMKKEDVNSKNSNNRKNNNKAIKAKKQKFNNKKVENDKSNPNNITNTTNVNTNNVNSNTPVINNNGGNNNKKKFKNNPVASNNVNKKSGKVKVEDNTNNKNKNKSNKKPKKKVK